MPFCMRRNIVSVITLWGFGALDGLGATNFACVGRCSFLAIAFDSQHFRSKEGEEPNNLFEPMQGYDQVEGDFKHLEILV